MKYLVLGSAGQIGLSLVAYLKDQGYQVMTYDIAQDRTQDLRNPNQPELSRMVNECDFVFHLAWDVGGSGYLARYQDTFEFIHNNLAIMVTTFDVLHRSGKPFIFASSQMASMSYSSYGLTKNLAEKIVKSLDAITVKFWNVYGIEHDPAKTHVVTDFINKARNNKIIDMRTDGTEVRQMLHADDCSRALYVLSQRYNELPRDREYHITNFEWTSMLEVAEIIAEHFPGTKVVPSTNKDTVQKDARNEADPWILQYWKPTISVRQGIADIIDHMMTQD